jgi:hypothetical protein
MNTDPNNLIPCKYCKHFLNCTAEFSCKPDYRKCHWEPSRFASAFDSPIDSRGEPVASPTLAQEEINLMAHHLAHDVAVAILNAKIVRYTNLSATAQEIPMIYYEVFAETRRALMDGEFSGKTEVVA